MFPVHLNNFPNSLVNFTYLGTTTDLAVGDEFLDIYYVENGSFVARYGSNERDYEVFLLPEYLSTTYLIGALQYKWYNFALRQAIAFGIYNDKLKTQAGY